MKNGNLKIEPCIPNEWNEYKIRYLYKTSVYNIYVKNVSKNTSNVVKSFRVNGEEIQDKKVKLIDNGRIYEVEVEL